MKREDLKFIKAVYDRMFTGAYEPADVQKAYEMITGVATPVKFSIKKNTIYSFINYKYSQMIEKLEEPVENLPKIEPMETPKTEKVETSKPKAKRKKRVYNRKTNKQSVRVEHEEKSNGSTS